MPVSCARSMVRLNRTSQSIWQAPDVSKPKNYTRYHRAFCGVSASWLPRLPRWPPLSGKARAAERQHSSTDKRFGLRIGQYAATAAWIDRRAL